MGQIVSSLLGWFSSNREHKVLLVGLDNAGKTTTLYQLHLGESIETRPTIGSNVETVKHKNVHFEVWDLGGQATLRPSWVTFYKATDAVVVVVDSTDRARMDLLRCVRGDVLPTSNPIFDRSINQHFLSFFAFRNKTG